MPLLSGQRLEKKIGCIVFVDSNFFDSRPRLHRLILLFFTVPVFSRAIFFFLGIATAEKN